MSDDQETRLAALMAAAQNGDGPAYQALLRACVPVAAGTARRSGVPADRVDDVVQEVLLTVHRARATYDPARPFLPWLRAIAQRRAVDALRRRGRQERWETHDPDAVDRQATAGPTAEEALHRSDRTRQVAEAVALLPEAQRQAVERLSFREQSLDEASAETGRSKVSLKVNLHRALKSLRSSLARGDENV